MSPYHTLVGALLGFFLVCSAAAQAQPAKPLPHVVVLATGGTIAAKGASTTTLAGYTAGAILGEELLAAVPEVKQHASVTVEQVVNVASSNITIENWLAIAKRINAIFAADPNVAGVVVTHGTDTLEETAYFLNLTVKHDRPVVVVGSMRPATAISADGPLNLLNAVRTAVAPVSRGKGVLVVMNDAVNGARDVTKSTTFRVEAFRSGELGMLGYVDPDQVVFYRASTRRHTAQSEFDVSELAQLPRVDIVYTYVQPEWGVVDTLVKGGAKGIVFAGSGAGSISVAGREVIAKVNTLAPASRPVMVRASRTGNGRVIDTAVYTKLDVVPADNLNPQKARILLMLALTRTSDTAEIRRMFREY